MVKQKISEASDTPFWGEPFHSLTFYTLKKPLTRSGCLKDKDNKLLGYC